jgi:hypothetical protein
MRLTLPGGRPTIISFLHRDASLPGRRTPLSALRTTLVFQSIARQIRNTAQSILTCWRRQTDALVWLCLGGTSGSLVPGQSPRRRGTRERAVSSPRGLRCLAPPKTPKTGSSCSVAPHLMRRRRVLHARELAFLRALHSMKNRCRQRCAVTSTPPCGYLRLCGLLYTCGWRSATAAAGLESAWWSWARAWFTKQEFCRGRASATASSVLILAEVGCTAPIVPTAHLETNTRSNVNSRSPTASVELQIGRAPGG